MVCGGMEESRRGVGRTKRREGIGGKGGGREKEGWGGWMHEEDEEEEVVKKRNKRRKLPLIPLLLQLVLILVLPY